MKAVVYHGPGDLRLEERPRPDPGPGEALLQIKACGICGTDLRIAAGVHRAYPAGVMRVPGHEIAGVVAARGAGVNLTEGVPVFVAPNVGCGRCASCRAGRVNLCSTPAALGITLDGGFAEYVLLRADLIAQGNLLAAPDTRDFGALALVEPLACVLRGSRACEIAAGQLVLISGAGPIGLLHLRVAKLRAPRAVVVSEPNARRRTEATRWGADYVVDPTTGDLPGLIADISNGAGADAIVVAVPAPEAQKAAIELAAVGGHVNFFGGLPRDRSQVTIDANLIHYRELTVTGTTANTTQDCVEALELVATGQIDLEPLISARYPLSDFQDALEAAGSGRSLKVVFEPERA